MMQKGFVRKTKGRYVTVYALYDEANVFLLNCVTSHSIPGLFLFSTYRNAQWKMLEDISNMPQLEGSMTQVGEDGCNFVIRSLFNHELGFVRFAPSVPHLPLSMELILPEDDSAVVTTPTQASRIEQLWTEQQESIARRESLLSRLSAALHEYHSVSTDPEETCTCLRLVTQEPRYNHEYQSFMLNFSGRAAVASRQNFILRACAEDDDTYKLCFDNGGQQELGDFAMVHYKGNDNTFIVELRDPVTAQVALGLSVAAQVRKGADFSYSEI